MKRPAASSLLNKTIILSTIFLMGTLPVVADDLDDLKKQVEILAKRIEQLESQRNQTLQTSEIPIATTNAIPRIEIPADDDEVRGTIKRQPGRAVTAEDSTTASTNNLVTGGDAAGTFKLPNTNTSIKISGYAQTNFMYDVMARPRSRGGDSATVGTLPLQGDSDYAMRGDTRISSRDSRLAVTTYTPTDYGLLRTVVEGDFNGPPNDKASRGTSNRTAFGLRHAYGQLGGFLAGQTYSNFMDFSVFPGKLDGAGPVSRTFVRQGQFRYIHQFDQKQELAVAVENPRGDFFRADDDTLDDSLPDLTAHYRYETGRWHLQFSSVLRRLGIDDGIPASVNANNTATSEEGELIELGASQGLNDNTFGWGLNQSGSFLIGDGQDRAAWYLIFGDGVGRYIEGGIDQGATVNAQGKLDTQFGYGGYITFQHWWTETLQSNIDFGIGKYNLNPEASPGANESLYSSHTNLIWTPIEKFLFGIEYVWGNRQVHDGREGHLRRLQFTSMFYF